jgi:hypothetical protein
MMCEYPQAWAGFEDRPVWLFVPKSADTVVTDLAVENQTRGCVFTVAVVPKEDTSRYGGGGRGSGAGGPSAEALARDPELFMLPLSPGLPGEGGGTRGRGAGAGRAGGGGRGREGRRPEAVVPAPAAAALLPPSFALAYPPP